MRSDLSPRGRWGGCFAPNIVILNEVKNLFWWSAARGCSSSRCMGETFSLLRYFFFRKGKKPLRSQFALQPARNFTLLSGGTAISAEPIT